MAWETSLTNRREGGRNRTRDRKGTSKPEDPAHKREPLTERGFRALAEPRPVLRGLRPPSPRRVFSVVIQPSCRAETRSQGIATLALLRLALGLDPALQSRDPFSGDCDSIEDFVGQNLEEIAACRAETRSQGIATLVAQAQLRADKVMLAEPRPVLRGLRRSAVGARPTTEKRGLAEPRPVLRGLRRVLLGLVIGLVIGPLQSRDPFSGDCDPGGHGRSGGGDPDGLQSRDPFSGDCDPAAFRGTEPETEYHACRAETRSQGIATAARAARTSSGFLLAEPRPVLRGLRPSGLRAGR